MEKIAPGHLAEKWDNVGLQVGQEDWPVKSVWFALDPSPEVVDAACRGGCDLLITHHPLIFKPLKKIDSSTPIGAMIKKALHYQTAIFTAHTNLDAVRGGLNDSLAMQLGLQDIRVLGGGQTINFFKLVVQFQKAHEKEVMGVLAPFKVEYGDGTFPDAKRQFVNKGTNIVATGIGAEPKGAVGPSNFCSSLYVKQHQFFAATKQLDALKSRMQLSYDFYPVGIANLHQGIGRVGMLSKPLSLNALAKQVKRKLKLKYLKISGRADLPVNIVALCTGSGSGLMKDFMASGAQVYISGDLHYHDGRDVLDADLGLIDIGHFASEHPVIDLLAKQMENVLAQKGLTIEITRYLNEKDPFYLV